MKKPVLTARKKIEIRKFARKFVENGGVGVQAMLDTKPMTYDSARQAATRLLKREDVQAEIIKALDATGIDYKYVLGARKQFVEKGIDQLENGRTAENEVLVSPGDVSKHLQGMETVLDRVGLLSKNDGNGANKHLHLHLDSENVGEIIKQRNQSKSFFDGILGTNDLSTADFDGSTSSE